MSSTRRRLPSTRPRPDRLSRSGLGDLVAESWQDRSVTGRLMLLDSASLYFRAFYGVPDSIGRARTARPVNAVRGFLDMIATLVDQPPSGPAGRLLGRRLAPGVPGRRDPVVQGAPAGGPGDQPGRGGARRARPAGAGDRRGAGRARDRPGRGRRVRGRRRDRHPGRAGRAAGGGPVDVEVVTGDRDLFQLVDDAAGVRVLYIGRGVRNLEVVDAGPAARALRRTPTARPTPTWRSCAATRATGCPAWPGSGRRRRPVCSRATGPGRPCSPPWSGGTRGCPRRQRGEAGRGRRTTSTAAPLVVRVALDAARQPGGRRAPADAARPGRRPGARRALGPRVQPGQASCAPSPAAGSRQADRGVGDHPAADPVDRLPGGPAHRGDAPVLGGRVGDLVRAGRSAACTSARSRRRPGRRRASTASSRCAARPTGAPPRRTPGRARRVGSQPVVALAVLQSPTTAAPSRPAPRATAPPGTRGGRAVARRGGTRRPAAQTQAASSGGVQARPRARRRRHSRDQQVGLGVDPAQPLPGAR